MGHFTKAPLRLLDRLYRFVGGLRGRSEMDLQSPIVRVHDVSREAELGTIVDASDGSISANFPYFTIAHDNIHAGADTQRTVLGVYSNQTTTWALSTWDVPDPTLETVWILAVFATGTNALTEAYVLNDMLPLAGAGSTAAPQTLLWHSSDLVDAAGTNGRFAALPTAGLQPNLPVPITGKVTGGTPLDLISVSSAALTFDFFLHCIRLPIGVAPPGMA